MGVDKTSIEKALLQAIRKHARLERKIFSMIDTYCHRGAGHPDAVEYIERAWDSAHDALAANHKEMLRLIKLLSEN